MNRIAQFAGIAGAMTLVAAFGWTSQAHGAAADVNEGALKSVTYSKEIARMVQGRCQECHRPEGLAPFSLTNYRQVKAWSKMIREVVDTNRMPPWHADPEIGHFRNDRSLSAEEKAQLFYWIDNGMPRGNQEDLPEPYEFSNKWRIGEPDMVFTMPEEVTIEPTGVVDYMYFTTPTGFTEDKWIVAMEARGGNPKVVHHILLFAAADGGRGERDQFQGIGSGFLTGFAPGTAPHVMEPGQAVKIPAGANIIWQMHYTPTGKTETDRSEFAIKFADGPPEEEILTGTAMETRFKIPPHAKDFEVVATKKFPQDATFYAMTPHMHYRGSKYKYEVEFPDGRKETLLYIPQYDFNWQISYELAEPLHIPKGSTLTCTGWFDNSADNPYNPDPTKPVTWGDQTWEEMQIGWFTFSWKGEEAD